MIFEKVRTIICDNLNISEDEITADTSFIDDLHADSLDIVEVVIEMETEFDIEISDEDFPGINTVGDLVDYISAKIG